MRDMSAAIGRPTTVTSDLWEGTLVPVFRSGSWESGSRSSRPGPFVVRTTQQIARSGHSKYLLGSDHAAHVH